MSNLYKKTYNGVTIDIYRIGRLFGITCPARLNAMKKIIRAGRDGKSKQDDLLEAVMSLLRSIQMDLEDEKNSVNPHRET